MQGRQHPVTIYHTATSQPDYVDAALRTFFQIHTDQPPGDVLIFLPGKLYTQYPLPCISMLVFFCRSRRYREFGKIYQAFRRPVTEGMSRGKVFASL